MLDKLVVINQKSGGPVPQGANWFHWKTCLRQVSVGFMDAQGKRIPFSRGQTYFGVEAYQFFLEVVCGLHSPLVGETEVMGQFKELIDSSHSISVSIKSEALRFLKQALTDAKFIRQTLLRDLGSRTYGSLVRKFIKDSSSVVILGSGKLAQELLPWFKNGPPVGVWCRNLERAGELEKNFPSLSVRPLDKSPWFSETLVVAATMSALEIESLIKQSQSSFRQVIDLRESSSHDPISGSFSVVTLEQFFGQIKAVEQDTLLRVKKAKEDIRDLALKFYHVAEHRPFGWEDLCG